MEIIHEIKITILLITRFFSFSGQEIKLKLQNSDKQSSET